MTTQPVLTAEAKNELRSCNITELAWARQFFADGKWHGDKCGCPDDRCGGYHHEENEDCRCISALIEDWEA